MSSIHTTGLGDPEPVGKKALFQPPGDVRDKSTKSPKSTAEVATPGEKKSMIRVRTTIGLTRNAMKIIQDLQNRYRLRTGKVLPLWKLVSLAIEYYGKSKRGIKS